MIKKILGFIMEKELHLYIEFTKKSETKNIDAFGEEFAEHMETTEPSLQNSIKICQPELLVPN